MSSHGISPNRWTEIAAAFAHGGYVTPYEADAFLRLERGTTKRAILSGKIKGMEKPSRSACPRRKRYCLDTTEAKRQLQVVEP